jgi:hypothetical protein
MTSEVKSELKSDMVRSLFIDIGVENSCFYVEEFSPSRLAGIPKLSEVEKYIVLQENEQVCTLENYQKQYVSPAYQQYMNRFFLEGRSVFLEIADFTHPNDDHDGCFRTITTKKGVVRRIRSVKGNIAPLLVRVTQWLDQHKELFDNCSFIVIEEQVDIAPMNILIAQHMMSYFIIHYLNLKPVSFFSAKHKTKMLGAHPKIQVQKKRHKKFAVWLAKQICILREDHVTLRNILSNSKKDDKADAIISSQAVKLMLYG